MASSLLAVFAILVPAIVSAGLDCAGSAAAPATDREVRLPATAVPGSFSVAGYRRATTRAFADGQANPGDVVLGATAEFTVLPWSGARERRESEPRDGRKGESR